MFDSDLIPNQKELVQLVSLSSVESKSRELESLLNSFSQFLSSLHLKLVLFYVT